MDNVYLFTHLGPRFAADGQQTFDIKVRIVMTHNRCGELRHMFDSPFLNNRLKLRLYITAVVSVMTYGCESWFLTPKVMTQLNGVNMNMLTHIMGTDTIIMSERRSPTTHFHQVKDVRDRRLKWAGEILHMDSDRILHKTIESQLTMDVQLTKQLNP